MIRILLPVGLAFIMFSLGLGLKLRDFRLVLGRPWAIVAGLAAQMLLLPLTAFVIAILLGLSGEWAIGLMILAACPGGVTAGIITRMALGETALSITLTVLTSLAAFISVPLIVGAGIAWFGTATTAAIQMPLGQTIGGLFLVTLLPLCLGLLASERGWLPERPQQITHKLANGVFFLIVIYTFTNQWQAISSHLIDVGIASLALNLTTMATGAALGTLFALPSGSRIALAMECGIQNSALGITLAVSVLGMPQLAVPSVLYALLMNITAFSVIAYRQWSCRPVVAGGGSIDE